MMKVSRIAALFVIFVLPSISQGQSITLDEATQKARAAYPLLKQQELIEQVSALKTKNIRANWMPAVSLNAQASYQSDVSSLPIQIPNVVIPEMFKDSYKATFDIQQVIYDGGLTRAQNNIEEADRAIQLENLNIDLKKIELLTAEVFFNILILRKSHEQMLAMQSELQQQILLMESRVRNGVMQPSALDILKVESLSLQQKINELELLITANIEMLSTLMAQPLSESTVFIEVSAIPVNEKPSLTTPEFRLFDLNSSKLQQTESLLKVRNRPTLAAFAQLGYGRPGLNMFTTTFDSYYLVGIKASWSLWKGGNNNRERQIILIQQQMVQSQKDTYVLKMEVSRSAQWQKIQSLQSQLATDEEILALRTSIVKSYSSQLENGIITPTEYLNQLNSKTIAAITLEMHRIQLLEEQYNFNRTFGN